MLVAARGSKNPDSGCLYINRHAHCVAHRIVLGKKHRVDPVTILRKRGRNGEGTTRSGSNSSLNMTYNLGRARIEMHLCANLSYLPLQISLGDAQFDPIHLHARVSQGNKLATNMRIDAVGRRRMCVSVCAVVDVCRWYPASGVLCLASVAASVAMAVAITVAVAMAVSVYACHVARGHLSSMLRVRNEKPCEIGN